MKFQVGCKYQVLIDNPNGSDLLKGAIITCKVRSSCGAYFNKDHIWIHDDYLCNDKVIPYWAEGDVVSFNGLEGVIKSINFNNDRPLLVRFDSLNTTRRFTMKGYHLEGMTKPCIELVKSAKPTSIPFSCSQGEGFYDIKSNILTVGCKKIELHKIESVLSAITKYIKGIHCGLNIGYSGKCSCIIRSYFDGPYLVIDDSKYSLTVDDVRKFKKLLATVKEL